MATAPPQVNDQDMLLVIEEEHDLLEVSTQGPPGPPGPTGPSGGVSLQLIAKTSIGGHRVVAVDADSEAVYADASDLTQLGKVAGLTLDAAGVGGTVTVITSGLVAEPSWSWIPDQIVLLSYNGLLSQTQPVSGFVQVIGVALGPTTLFVSLRDPFTL